MISQTISSKLLKLKKLIPENQQSHSISQTMILENTVRFIKKVEQLLISLDGINKEDLYDIMGERMSVALHEKERNCMKIDNLICK
jgi:hypothetical protein